MMLGYGVFFSIPWCVRVYELTQKVVLVFANNSRIEVKTGRCFGRLNDLHSSEGTA